ncbi:MAG TPA: hypothetical protein VGE98_06800 [Thermoanaerobaculia bacterium]
MKAQPAPQAPAAAGQPAHPHDPSVLVGEVSRTQVEAAVPEWVQVEVEAKPDDAAAQALTQVPPGADVTVLFGTWCGDSRREVSRLWRALDDAGAPVPFAIHYIAVDETKKQPKAAVDEVGLRYVPTLIVRRDGHEIGRIIEVPPHGVEVDLLALLTGKAQGVLTASPKMAPDAAGAKAAHPGP